MELVLRMYGSSGNNYDIWLDENYALHFKDGLTVQDLLPQVQPRLDDGNHKRTEGGAKDGNENIISK